MKNTTKTKKQPNYPSKQTDWAYWMQAIEQKSMEINEAFPGYHPQWVIRSQLRDVSADGFANIRKYALKISRKQCAAYLRVSEKTILRWETGKVEIPFSAFELLRVVYFTAQFKLSHPDWDGWFISDNGKLVSPFSPDISLSPGEINLVPFLHKWNAIMKTEIEELKQELAKTITENTALRELFLANGITDEVAAMQDKINTLMARINTARVIPFAPKDEQELEEKVA